MSMVTLIASLILPAYDLGFSVRILKFAALFFRFPLRGPWRSSHCFGNLCPSDYLRIPGGNLIYSP